MSKIDALAAKVDAFEARLDAIDPWKDPLADRKFKPGTPVWANRTGARRETVRKQDGTTIWTEEGNVYHTTKVATKSPG